MKAMYLAPIALALALAGCGGKESYAVGGSVTGLKFSGMELTNGSDKVAVQPAADGSAVRFTFPKSIDYGDEYEIVIKNPAHQTCGPAISGGLKGSAGYTETIDVALVCSVNTHKLIGTVTGLNVAGLVIINGNGSEYTIEKDATSFTYTDAIPSQSSYGLVVLKQPAGKSCTIANGTGVMEDDDVKNIAITCVPA
ncbi:hypothetical protein ACFFTM_20235 [Pseudoduganella plicata]|uniref:Uncharacterized protein n=1 Tax=Pseudoduganella plicata TaxID=321984 RepID=A0A4P7BG39_9BURK|nr:hypothetical protein [Pseudoduganella plicata]QBQ37193.1 hypothetical protein E1742_14180 [Pseudoduganella plicata]GGY98648.1 hypothetical protein GCM10007388_35200 [Pseudoduganella plicata]